MLRTVFTLVVSIMALVSKGIAGENEIVKKKMEVKMNLEIKSSAFINGAAIPKKHTCDGEDVSPSLSWDKIPAGTKSWALICDDPDAPVGTWVHWVIYCIPPETKSFPEAIAKNQVVFKSAKQGKTDFGKIGYGGPCPPKGKPHRYFFKLYALDFMPDWPAGRTKAEVMKGIEGHILAQGELIGKYGR